MRLLLLLLVPLAAAPTASAAADPSDVVCVGHRGDDDPRLGGVPRAVGMDCATARCDSIFIDPIGTLDVHSIACEDPFPIPDAPVDDLPVLEDIVRDPTVSVLVCVESRNAVVLRNVVALLAQEDCSLHGQDRCVFSRGAEGELSVYSIACSGSTIGPI